MSFNAFITAICTDPDDDTPRLVFADWLQERGEPGDAERAEFIRLQCEIARIGNCRWCARRKQAESKYKNPSEPLPCKRCGRLRARERELLSDHRYLFLDGMLGKEWKLGGTDFIGGVGFFQSASVRTQPMRPEFFRGFVSSLTCTAEDWLKHADAVYWHPGQKCVSCGGLGGELDGYGANAWVPCGCDSGKRPCPDTAQPLRKVVLTTWPGQPADDGPLTHWALTAEWNVEGYATAFRNDDREFMIEELFKRRWPGLEVEWPPTDILERGETNAAAASS